MLHKKISNRQLINWLHNFISKTWYPEWMNLHYFQHILVHYLGFPSLHRKLLSDTQRKFSPKARVWLCVIARWHDALLYEVWIRGRIIFPFFVLSGDHLDSLLIGLPFPVRLVVPWSISWTLLPWLRIWWLMGLDRPTMSGKDLVPHTTQCLWSLLHHPWQQRSVQLSKK